MSKWCWRVRVAVFSAFVGCASGGGQVGGIGGNLDGKVELLEEYSVREEARCLRDKAEDRADATVQGRLGEGGRPTLDVTR